MKSLKTATVTVMSTDLQRSLDFYCKTVGLDLIENYGGHYAEVQAPGFRIGLHPSTKLVEGNAISLGFGVTAFDNEVENLRSKGIHVSLALDGTVRLASFQDPDGNGLFLAEVD